MSKKVCLVTGGGRGIGAAVAREMAARGHALVLMSPSDSCEKLAAELGGVARRGVAQSADDLKAIVDLALETHGRIDSVLNHTGHPPKGDLLAITDENWDLAHEMVIKSVVRMARLVTPVMERQGGGAIVNVSSIATRGVNRVPYGAAKGGVNALTACLALETAERGIRVNAIATGGTEAPPRRIPRNAAEQTEQEKVWYQMIVDQTINSSLMKRYGTIDEQVNAICFLASDEASYITGITMPVGGGDLG